MAGQLLLDSQVFVWYNEADTRLPDAYRRAIQDRGNTVYLSAATAWELSIKAAKGKLNLRGTLQDWLQWFDFQELPIRGVHGEVAARLPGIHADPFDRMLIAQAQVEGLTLVTADATVQRYEVAWLREN